MRILAINTASKQANITLWEDKGEIWELSYTTDNRSFGELLIPNLQTLLSKSHWSLEDIDLFVVTKGPGSFTGLRIGIVTIKTLAQIYEKPISAPTYLDVLAYQNKFPGLIFSIIPARKNEFHVSIYKNWDEFSKIEPEKVYEKNELIKKINYTSNILIVGEITKELEDLLPEELKPAVCHSTLKGSALAELGLIMFKNGESTTYLDLYPYYGQKSSAEINWEKIYGSQKKY
ncbi:MAG: tRNA (adenosine(37)-N6)-threonylcarbamoyltransferase complex dimerization subunit type 1 TsaB [Dictyoglomus sp. NZ13-RE01]|nr:MAG: tRNA (adenosine(37)-N6)-threonylcarbamoyltransferase complex dimerization subunit type 1 TsaB [Dictyoglomus sp. NZ13-RE01]